MGSIWLRDLPAVLASIPDVSYFAGWEYRSRSSGGFDNLFGIVCHHTATSTSFGFESYCRQAWTTHAAKPVANINLGRAGEIKVGCAGASNHAGVGGPRKMSKGTVPPDSGNRYLIGIEALNTGVGEPWPDVQQERYLALVEALCNGYGFDVSTDEVSHHEWTPRRKIDPAGPSRFGSINNSGTWDMNIFRSSVSGAPTTPPPTQPPTPQPIPPTSPASGVFTVANAYRKDVRQGTQGKMAKMCQQQINLIAGQGIAEDGNFGPQSVGALKNVQTVLGVPADGWCGQQTWQAFENGIRTQANAGDWD